MKKSLLFVAVASIFALASCGGEKAAETTSADTVSAVIDTTAAIDTTTAVDTNTTAAGDSVAK